jgi:hypothetical protein
VRSPDTEKWLSERLFSAIRTLARNRVRGTYLGILGNCNIATSVFPDLDSSARAMQAHPPVAVFRNRAAKAFDVAFKEGKTRGSSNENCAATIEESHWELCCAHHRPLRNPSALSKTDPLLLV